MAKANRIYLPKEESIARLGKLIDVLGLELYESQPSPKDDIVFDVIDQIEGIINMLENSAIENVNFFKIYASTAKTRSTTLRVQLPHPEITWKKFANLKND